MSISFSGLSDTSRQLSAQLPPAALHTTQDALLSVGLMWFRRDLRTADNAALFHALSLCQAVYCVFIFDTVILDDLPRTDRRVTFIWQSLVDLNEQIKQLSCGRARLLVLHGQPTTEIPRLAVQLDAVRVFANHDDEPYALQRDAQIVRALHALGGQRQLQTFKDHVIFERQEVLTQSGKPFTVFTPYKNAWLKKLASCPNGLYVQAYAVECWAHRLQALPDQLLAMHVLPSLDALGFKQDEAKNPYQLGGSKEAHRLLQDFSTRLVRYHETRDFPAIKGPSYLSAHVRFGTVSSRHLVRLALMSADVAEGHGNQGAMTWLSELIWRDFYHQIMANFPHAMTRSFKSEFADVVWEGGQQADDLFAAWCEARTGYPLVDAAMRQLNQTGYMHNRLRMVTASFLVKDLGIDWRWGERYFAKQLFDFDLASNNGGWQWAASTGCDAQPYFRIFNPTTQSQKFDPDGRFIKRYLPELAHLNAQTIHWPIHPVVDHATARLKTLARYGVGAKK